MLNRIRLAAAAALLLVAAATSAQTSPVRNDAILTHPIDGLATKTVDVNAAGQFDAVRALRTKMDQDEWKTTPAGMLRQAFALESGQWKLAQ